MNQPYYVNTGSLIPKPPLALENGQPTFQDSDYQKQLQQLQDQTNKNSDMIQQGIKYVNSKKSDTPKKVNEAKVKQLITREQQLKYNERARLRRQQAKQKKEPEVKLEEIYKDQNNITEDKPDLYKFTPNPFVSPPPRTKTPLKPLKRVNDIVIVDRIPPTTEELKMKNKKLNDDITNHMKNLNKLIKEYKKEPEFKTSVMSTLKRNNLDEIFKNEDFQHTDFKARMSKQDVVSL